MNDEKVNLIDRSKVCKPYRSSESDRISSSLPEWSTTFEIENSMETTPLFTIIYQFCSYIYDLLYSYISLYLVWVIFVLCIILGPLNFVMYKMLYTVYGDHGAYFVSQCINLLYVLFGAIVLKYITINGEIDQDTLNTPQINFVIMGFLDCFAGFLSAMGASNVSGASQQLLNQALIPCTMFASYCFLGSQSTYMQIFGAINILIGSFIVVLPNIVIFTPKGQPILVRDVYQLISAYIYFSSNIPFAASYVFKEYGFKNLSVHVIYLTQYVSIYQLLFGFLFAPLQTLPGMGSKDGMTYHGIITNFYQGYQCFLERTTECQENNTFILLIGYCIVNFTFNTTGLYLVKHGSATLNAISYAIILPITTLTFSLPFLGRYQEPFNIVTVLGLIIVLVGFFLWKGERLMGDVMERKRESLYDMAINLKKYKRIARDFDNSSSHGTSTTDGGFAELEIERTSFEKIGENDYEFVDGDECPRPSLDGCEYMIRSYQTSPSPYEEHHIERYEHLKDDLQMNSSSHNKSPRISKVFSSKNALGFSSPIVNPTTRHRVESFNERTIVVGLL